MQSTGGQQSRRWVFTICNPTDSDYQACIDAGTWCTYLVYADEVGEEGTPHIQGFIIFPTNKRLSACKAVFSRAHFEIAKGTSKQASDYCKKDRTNVVEFGQIPGLPGRTNQYEAFRDWVLAQPTKPTLAMVAAEYPSIFLRHNRTQLFIDSVFPQAAPVPCECYRWYQQSLADELDGEPNPRKIIFVVDTVGNTGKSWFANKYVRANPGRAQILSVGRRDDIAYAVDELKSVFLFDIPRSTSEFIQYPVLEQLKNGIVQSNKYESRVKIMGHETCHVVVLMNEFPKMDALSADRYEIITWN